MMRLINYCVAMVALIVGLCILFYYYPRHVSFELAKEILKPSKEFDNSQFIGFEYVDSKDRLVYWLVEHYKHFYPDGQLYDSNFVDNLGNELDFRKFDYIITYQKQLKELRHSPYLTKAKDDLYFDKKTPLIPTWDSVITNKVYLYRIKKNNKYRSPGP